MVRANEIQLFRGVFTKLVLRALVNSVLVFVQQFSTFSASESLSAVSSTSKSLKSGGKSPASSRVGSGISGSS